MIDGLLERLQQDKYSARRIAHIEVLPPRQAFHCDVDDLSPSLQKYLDSKNIRLYLHQCDVIDQLRKGNNVIITTPTASGKTLAFNLPVFEELERKPRATALYLYPTKALANDQLASLREMEDITGIKVNPAIYDGDISSQAKARIRTSARIILSNPYELHHILVWSYKWVGFWSNLRYVVIDEAHHYRGVFGSNVAYLLRRLRRILKRYGASPQFVLSSATLANPQEFATKLTGLDFVLVDRDGAPRGRKYFVLYNPFFTRDADFSASAHYEAARLLAFLVKKGLKTLVFNVSRRTAELVAMRARELLQKHYPQAAEKITVYRAGYLPQDRRRIEQDFRQGRLLGISATNALELGVDIGDLHAVIISGFPGTMISLWQQAGRAGRRGKDALAVLVAFSDKLDQYFMRHPRALFDRPHEHAIVDLENPYIAGGHILCAAAEAPLNEDDIEFFPEKVSKFILAQFRKQGLIKETPHGLVYSGRVDPTQAVSLDTISSDTFKVMEDSKLLETMSREQAFREAHQDAVILHRAQTYVVQDFDLDNKIITVVKKKVDYHTEPLKRSQTFVVKQERQREIGGLRLYFGRVRVTEQYVAYKIVKGDKTVGYGDLDLPPLEFETKGLWFTLDKQLADRIWEKHPTQTPSIPSQMTYFEGYSLKDDVFAGGLHAVEHAMIGMMPFHVMADRWDLGGMSTILHPDTGKPTIFVYDGYPGGIGLTEKAFFLFEDIVLTTYDLVRDCGCQDGCPSCIMSPKCGNDNRPLDKQASIMILEHLLKLMRTPSLY